jgi:hypothetical protein
MESAAARVAVHHHRAFRAGLQALAPAGGAGLEALPVNEGLRHFSMCCVYLSVHAIEPFHQPLLAGWQTALAKDSSAI